MRRWLVRVFLAVSAMIIMAFVAPLAVLIRTTAEDRAIDAALADAAAVVPALVVGGTVQQVESAVGATKSGNENRLTIVTPDGTVIGAEVGITDRVAAALDSGASGIGDVTGGKEIVSAVADGSGGLSAIRVFVPQGELRQGQWAAWLTLAVVALLLTAIAVAIADRLARTVVRPVEHLAEAARKLGSGDFGARVEPEGPVELVDLGQTFNELGSRIAANFARERELLAELSHRLRTPLTPLRLKIDRVQEVQLADDLQRDVDELTIIINELIEEARRGASRPRPTRCDVASLVSDRVGFWSVLAEDQHRTWRFTQQGDRAPVAIGEDELAAAVDVLIENVFAHTEEGVSLEIRVSLDNESVRIGVHDGGPGIDETLVAVGQSGGGSTGLGLSIATRTAKRAGGEVIIGTSDLGGTLVELVLPLELDR